MGKKFSVTCQCRKIGVSVRLLKCCCSVQLCKPVPFLFPCFLRSYSAEYAPHNDLSKPNKQFHHLCCGLRQDQGFLLTETLWFCVLLTLLAGGKEDQKIEQFLKQSCPAKCNGLHHNKRSIRQSNRPSVFNASVSTSPLTVLLPLSCSLCQSTEIVIMKSCSSSWCLNHTPSSSTANGSLVPFLLPATTVPFSACCAYLLCL